MKKSLIHVALSSAAVVALASQAYGGAVLVSGPVAIGVNDEGHLNFSDGVIVAPNAGDGTAVGVAIRSVAGTLLDSTSPGCLCEGWGASANGISGYANIDTDFGVNNLTLNSFVSTATTATSVTTVTGLDLGVSQAYAPSVEAPTVLFENKVTLTNNSNVTMNDVRYSRAMDWDVPPTEFSEHVTIIGTATTTLLELSHDNGFSTNDPLNPDTELNAGTTNVDFVDVIGPDTDDHGAYFLFNFGTLEPGETQEFSIFYGAAYSERTAVTALFDVGAELYSLGQSSAPDGNPVAGTPYTFAFGFKGVGGIIIDPTIPEPSAAGFLGFGLVALVLGLRRRR